mmetsp:Transcript_71099/g.126013  ORF Transcript_71099/g.126013 Transcript_71099/m.126013 type:complete len:472 (-) Transcript_71099:35-1450(-)
MKAVMPFVLGQLVSFADSLCQREAEKVSPSPDDKNFGDVVDLRGDTLAVGGDVPTTGKIWIFKKTDSSWTQTFVIDSGNVEDHQKLGDLVKLDRTGNELVATNKDEKNPAQVYRRSGNHWHLAYTVTLGSQYRKNGMGGNMPRSYNRAWRTAIDGDTFAISSGYTHWEDSGIQSAGRDPERDIHESGRVFVFIRSGDSWTEQAIITQPDPERSHNFGQALDLKGDDIAVGVPNYFDTADQSRPITGAAFVFTRSGSTWSLQQQLMAPADETQKCEDKLGMLPSKCSDGAFGDAVSFGRTGELAVGDYYKVNTKDVNHGAIYVFTRSGTTWGTPVKIVEWGNNWGDNFAKRVQMSENDVIIASAYEESNDAGAVYVFRKVGAAWMQESKIIATDSRAYHKFGFTLGMSTDGVMAVGAAYHGAAYVYKWCTTTTTTTSTTNEFRQEASASYSLQLARPFVMLPALLLMGVRRQ